jgi:hypothetical protein
VIRHYNPSIVCLVYENDANPVINSLKHYLTLENIEFRISSSSLKSDLVNLIYAEALVVGIGTFSKAILSLNRELNTLYTFNIDSTTFTSDLSFNRSTVIYNVIDSCKNYVSCILQNNWSNSNEQRQLMLSYEEENLTIHKYEFIDNLIESMR